MLSKSDEIGGRLVLCLFPCFQDDAATGLLNSVRKINLPDGDLRLDGNTEKPGSFLIMSSLGMQVLFIDKDCFILLTEGLVTPITLISRDCFFIFKN